MVPFTCDAIAIHDADGPIHCTSGVKIRLQGVAARELDGSCGYRQPCPPGSPVAARKAVARVMGAKVNWWRSDADQVRFAAPVQLSCVQTGVSHKRVVAWCRLPNGRDLSCEAIRVRAVVRWAKFDRGRRLVGCG